MPDALGKFKQSLTGKPSFRSWVRRNATHQMDPHNTTKPKPYLQQLARPISQRLYPNKSKLGTEQNKAQGPVGTTNINYNVIHNLTGDPYYFSKLKQHLLQARQRGLTKGLFTDKSIDQFNENFNSYKEAVPRHPLTYQNAHMASAPSSFNGAKHEIYTPILPKKDVDLLQAINRKRPLAEIFESTPNEHRNDLVIRGFKNRIDRTGGYATSNSPLTRFKFYNVPAQDLVEDTMAHELNHTFSMDRGEGPSDLWRKLYPGKKSDTPLRRPWETSSETQDEHKALLLDVDSYAVDPVEVIQAALSANQGRLALRSRILENPDKYKRLNPRLVNYIVNEMPDFWANQKQATAFANKVLNVPQLYKALPIQAQRHYGNYKDFNGPGAKYRTSQSPSVRNMRNKFNRYWWLY